mgnify:FL=1
MISSSLIYDWLSSVNLEIFKKKSILIIGSGFIAREYCKIFQYLKCQNVIILGNSEKSSKKLADEYKFKYIFGGFEKKLNQIEKKDLVIICTPIHLLLEATKLCLSSGQKNILIEKPGTLYPEELLKINKQITDQTVKIGFNRILYPSQLYLKKLIENEEITSCHFRFTEWIDTINFEKYQKDAYSRWGISNSLHVIGMAFNLIENPKKISSYQQGGFDWHPSGSIFTGSGLSKKNIPFSYHADWESLGSWDIEIFTKGNSYRLKPLEELYVFDTSSKNWKKMETKTIFLNLKPGLGEQVIMMLSDEESIQDYLISLSNASELIKTTEQIFAYD